MQEACAVLFRCDDYLWRRQCLELAVYAFLIGRGELMVVAESERCDVFRCRLQIDNHLLRRRNAREQEYMCVGCDAADGAFVVAEHCGEVVVLYRCEEKFLERE